MKIHEVFQTKRGWKRVKSQGTARGMVSQLVKPFTVHLLIAVKLDKYPPAHRPFNLIALNVLITQNFFQVSPEQCCEQWNACAIDGVWDICMLLWTITLVTYIQCIHLNWGVQKRSVVKVAKLQERPNVLLLFPYYKVQNCMIVSIDHNKCSLQESTSTVAHLSDDLNT